MFDPFLPRFYFKNFFEASPPPPRIEELFLGLYQITEEGYWYRHAQEPIK
jgi:hypothetical protein